MNPVRLSRSPSLLPPHPQPPTKHSPCSQPRACSTGLRGRDLGVPRLGSTGRLQAGSSMSPSLLGFTCKMQEGDVPCRLSVGLRQSSWERPAHIWRRVGFLPTSLHGPPQPSLPGPLSQPTAKATAKIPSHLFPAAGTISLPSTCDAKSPLSLCSLNPTYRWKAEPQGDGQDVTHSQEAAGPGSDPGLPPPHATVSLLWTVTGF